MEFPVINSRFEHVNSFLNTLAPIVVNEYVRRKKMGHKLIFPATCLAQAALESGWNLEASTLFGIKGEGVITNTQEYVDGAYINIVDSFQHYPSITEAVVGYYDLMQWDNYDDATSADTVEGELEGLTNDIGYAYATSPTYKENVLSIINDYGLRAFNDYALSLFAESSVEEEQTPAEEVKIEEVIPTPAPALKYWEGLEVTYSLIYSTEESEEGLTPYFSSGIITHVNKDARNPYMIGEGTGFVNDEVITGVVVGKVEAPVEEEIPAAVITEGSKVRFIGSTDYDGVGVTAWREYYKVKQLTGDRAVLVNEEGKTFCAVNVADIELF